MKQSSIAGGERDYYVYCEFLCYAFSSSFFRLLGQICHWIIHPVIYSSIVKETDSYILYCPNIYIVCIVI